MKTIGPFLTFLIVFSSYLLADESTAQRTKRDEKKQQVAELDRLMEAIHLDLKELRKDHQWLSEYSDRCLWTDKHDQHRSIFYMRKPKVKPGQPQPAQPSQIIIGYSPLDRDDRENDVKGVPACQFPSLKSKVWAKLLIREGTAEAIRGCIIKRCEGLHKKMEREKLPIRNRISGSSRETENEAENERACI